MIRAVILDDETKGSSLLEHKINAIATSVIVERIYQDPILALQEIKEVNPDVLFLDVEMPNMNGFQFLEQLGVFNFEVIFVTAYNAYAIDALRNNALDYLLKPVNPEELACAIDKLKEKLSNKVRLIDNINRTAKKSNSRLALPTAEGVYLVKKENILKVEAMSNYSVFHTCNSLSKIIVSKTLKEFELFLEEDNFLRVNRSMIVNLDFVVRYKKGDGGVLELIDGTEVEVSSTKKSVLMERLFDF